ncbi:cytochrome P450 [Podospora appendiculata]|uniref:Cytochrome P450 n=1 Tax=Podospora appendiculata TaxID=314037 RepID=A0AAE0XAI2_9PEZI|nr:cytochrome P450 [Podospora appendiculata]
MELTLGAIGGTALALFIGCLLLEAYFASSREPGEPANVRPWIPLIGHGLGIMRNRTGYFSRIDAKLKTGIFALQIFSFRMYVVTDRALITPVQRAARTISFNPFIKKANAAFVKLSDKGLDLHDDASFLHDFKNVSVKGMAPGADLDRLNLVTVQEELHNIDRLAAQCVATAGKPVLIDLMKWIQHLLSISATEGIYGPQNPFKNAEHEKSFWTFHSKLKELLIGVLPGLIARKAVKAQSANGGRYESFLRNKGHETASATLQARTSLFADRDLSLRENAWMNIGYDVAILANFVPTAFWAVYNVISRPALLAQIRDELVATETVARDADDGSCVLDLSRLRTSCPLMLSAFQETQRVATTHAMIREVLADTTISTDTSSYLLKKGAYVQVASVPTLRSAEIWGDDPAVFDPHRFIKLKKDAASSIVRPADLPSAAFPVWGIAPHVCPARQYASTGCLALVAMLAMRFEFLPAEGGGGEWKARLRTRIDFQSVVLPDEKVRVCVRLRKGWNEGVWRVVVGEVGTRMVLAVH